MLLYLYKGNLGFLDIDQDHDSAETIGKKKFASTADQVC